MMKFEILNINLLEDFKKEINFNPLDRLAHKAQLEIPFDSFKFYRSISSVYSSKIEGETVEMDSYMKHKFLKVQYKPDYTKRADDLFEAYEFSEQNQLNAINVQKAHILLSKNLLAESERGKIRTNPMFVMNEEDRIEYVACPPSTVKEEWNRLFSDIDLLKKQNLSVKETFFFASLIHLVFLKIHPMQDGNGRTARLIEKWFLQEQLGTQVLVLELEKNYFLHKQNYYNNIRQLGLEYEKLNYTKSLDFLLMTVLSLQ